MHTSYIQPSGLFVSSTQIPTSPIGDFFNDQDDMEMDSDTRSLDIPAPVKFVRQDSVRMRQAASIASPSTAIIEKLPAPLSSLSSHHSTHQHIEPLTPASLPSPHLIEHQSQQSRSSQQQQQQQHNQQHQHHQQQQHQRPQVKSHSSYHEASHQTQHSHKQKNTPQNPIEAMVQSGIEYHERSQLEKATDCFRQAATMDSPMGMFLYGVSLRHGWGCKKSEQLAFQYLQKAAEHAVLDLNSLSSTVNTSASKGELIIAIYEMGVSFRHGWGCKKNKETAVHFFKIAADLGDPDAQNDLGHCYHHGNGIKKDLHLAAKYYRKADKQGHGLMGNSWIWKSKYD
ncbi:unnamed protein product [Absidia cylindrospora]